MTLEDVRRDDPHQSAVSRSTSGAATSISMRRDLDNAIADFSAAIGIDAARAFSLYGRGMARLISGDAAGQNEMEAAMMLQRNVPEEFKAYGGEVSRA